MAVALRPDGGRFKTSAPSINIVLLTEDADAITAFYKHGPPDGGRFTYDGGRRCYHCIL
jgi:hypothetical protein